MAKSPSSENEADGPAETTIMLKILHTMRNVQPLVSYFE